MLLIFIKTNHKVIRFNQNICYWMQTKANNVWVKTQFYTEHKRIQNLKVI